MEKVAFIIEATGERVECLLNPETFRFRRTAGLILQPPQSRRLAGRRRRDDPVVFAGGGVTEIDLTLLFDVDSYQSAIPLDRDVRTYSGAIVKLAEGLPADANWEQVPLVRFVWGKAWNVPGVVTSVSETLERFTTQGIPQRSWLRMTLRRAQLEEEVVAPSLNLPLPAILTDINERTEEEIPEPSADDRELVFHRGDRLDDVAARVYGDPRMWRWIAYCNQIEDPLRVPPGTVLRLPPPSPRPPPPPPDTVIA